MRLWPKSDREYQLGKALVDVKTLRREAADRERDLNAERDKARRYQDALQEISAGAWRGYMNASEYAEAVLTDG